MNRHTYLTLKSLIHFAGHRRRTQDAGRRTTSRQDAGGAAQEDDDAGGAAQEDDDAGGGAQEDAAW